MGGGQGVLIERLATGGFPAMETRPIPGGCTDLDSCAFACGSAFLRLGSRGLGDRYGSGLRVGVWSSRQRHGRVFQATSREAPQQHDADDVPPCDLRMNESHSGFLLGCFDIGSKTHAMPLASG